MALLWTLVVISVISVSSGQDTTDACDFWTTLSNRLSNMHQRQNTLRLTCEHHKDPCTQLDCSGTYVYSPMFGLGNSSEIDFCFGAILNHCDDPVSIDYFLQVPAKQVTFNKRISHNTSIKVDGLTYDFESLGRADVFLFFEMTRPSKDANHVLFSVKVKIRVTTLIGESYPELLQRTLFPEQRIPVPTCAKRVTAPPATFNLGDCKVKKIPKITTTTKPALIVSKTYNRACTLGLLGTCHSKNEMCSLKTKKNRSGVCLCRPGYGLSDSTGYCEKFLDDGFPNIDGNPTPSVKVQPSKQVGGKPDDQNGSGSGSTSASKSMNMTPVIAGAVVGGLLLIVVIVTVAILLVRRRRMYYHGRELLLTNDDTEVIM